MEEHAVEVVIVVLAGMRQNDIEIFTRFVDDRRKTDDLRACADDDQQL